MREAAVIRELCLIFAEGRKLKMKEEIKMNQTLKQNFKLNNVEEKNEKVYMKIIDITIAFALLVVLFVSVYYHII